jgi:hypothetical protein
MDLFVLLTSASFGGALLVASITWRGLLGSTLRRPVLFRGLALGVAAVGLVAVGALISAGPAGGGPGLGAVGPVWAFYSVLMCLVSAYALLRGRARLASDPQEG